MRVAVPTVAAAPTQAAEPTAPVAAIVTLDDVVVAPAGDPFASISTSELRRRWFTDRASLGSLSIGLPNAGRLVNGVNMVSNVECQVLNPLRSWATVNTADALARTAHSLHSDDPSAAPLVVGDISGQGGGWFSPHSSHQSGLDADLGYFYKDGSRWYSRATADNLDVARSWALVRSLVREGDVQYIFMDRHVQQLLSAYAAAQGVDAKWLDSLFECRGNRQAVVRHRFGHATHLHVRFFDDRATRAGARIARLNTGF